MLSAGTSRDGVLAVVHAAERPDLFDGAVNFAGGWLGEGCEDSVAVNRSSFAHGGTFPGTTIWLYGDNDTFYSLTAARISTPSSPRVEPALFASSRAPRL